MIMKRVSKIAFSISILLVVGLIILWFGLLPRSLFPLGMGLPEIERRIGKHYELIPLGMGFSSKPSLFELTNRPCYQLQIKIMATDIYLNSYKQAVCVKTLLGTEGKLVLTIPAIEHVPE